MKYAKVAVESAVYTFDKAFDYAIPAELEQKVKKGCRVTVPFGNGNRKRIGIVFDLSDVTESKRIKKITEVLDEEPLLNEEMLSLAEWIKDRTFCTYFEGIRVQFPAGYGFKTDVKYFAVATKMAHNLSDTEKQVYDYMLTLDDYAEIVTDVEAVFELSSAIEILSDAPTRVKILSTTPICAAEAGTNEPICAIRMMRAV